MSSYKDLIKKAEKKKIDLPTVEIEEAFVKHDLKAIKVAKAEFGEDYTVFQGALAKMACICKFNGENWNIPKIQELPTKFIAEIMEVINEEDQD